MNTPIHSQPLLVLGDRRREAVLSRARDGARRWRESWAPAAADTFELQCEPPAAGGFAGAVASVTTSCWAIDRGAERIAVLLLPHSTFVWCVLEAGATTSDPGGDPAADSLAGQLEREVAHSLAAQLCGDGTLVASRVGADALAEWSRHARAWSLHARSGAGRSFTLLLAATCVEALAPTRGVTGGHALRPRREAIGENLLSLRAIVGDTSLSVGDLAALALDDVLVLDQRLAEPIAIVSRTTGTAVAAGNLGRSGARRAIKVSGPASHGAGAHKN